MADPFRVLAQAIAGKSNLRLVRVPVLTVGTGDVEVEYRGATVTVPYTGSAPALDALIWMLVDDGVMVALT